ncbi:MAG: hypothetical protein EBU96_09225 [Actinobacteria bacterium]|nr:hypothetical protein [Actinomycetota bacterium]
MLKTLKRKIALVAVAGLGFGLVSTVPAFAAVSAIGFNVAGQTTDTGAPVIQRSDDANTLTVDINATGVIAASAAISFTISRNGGTATTTLPAGMTITWVNAQTDSSPAGANAPANNLTPVYAAVGDIADDAKIGQLTVAKTAAPGKYVLSVKAVATNDAVTHTFYVSGAPTAIAWDKTSYTLDAAGTAAASLALTDVLGNPTYLLAGEAIDVAITGATGNTKPTTNKPLIDTGSATNAATAVASTLDASGPATAGTYTLTASRSAGLTGLANAVSSIVVGSAPVASSALGIKDLTYVNWDVAAAGDNVADGTFDGATDIAPGNTTDNVYDTVYVSTAAPALTFVGSTDTDDLTTGNLRFAVSANGGASYPNGVTAVTSKDVAVTDTTGANNKSTAEYTVTSVSPVAGSGYRVSVKDGANVQGLAITYQNPVPNSIALTSPASSPILVKKTGSVTATATVKDQFGVVIPNVYVAIAITGRNAQSKNVLTDASGVVSITWTDAYVESATNTATADAVSFTIAGTGGANGMPAAVNAANLTVNYVASADVATLTVAGLNESNDANQTYTVAGDTAMAADGTTAFTVVPDLTLGNTLQTDQALITATAKDASGAVMQGVPVVFTATDGVFMTTGTLDMAATIVPVAGSTAVKTKTVYSGNDGTARVQVRFTKTGTATVTATSGTATGSISGKVSTAKGLAHSIAITNGSAAADGAATVTATVKDPFGNVVSGAAVSFVGTGALFLNGLNAVSGTTDTNGQIVVQALAGDKTKAGSATIKATVTEVSLVGLLATDSKVTTTTLALTAGTASATSTLTFTAPNAGGASTAVDAVKSDVASVKTDVKAVSDTVATLSKAVTTIQSSVTELTSSFATQIKSLTDAIAKISAAIAALSKKVSAKK